MKHSNPSSASNDSPRNPPVMTVAELAQYLRVHTRTIYRLLRGKAIPGFQVGSDWRFNVESIDAWRLGSSAQVESPVKRLSSDKPR